MMRAMLLEFVDDPTCLHLDRQYMLGGDLLVAPVFSDEGEVEFYVPAGEWIDFLTCQPVTGPTWIKARCDFFHLPLLVRPNAVIPVGDVENRSDYDSAEGVTLEVFAFESGARSEVIVPSAGAASEARFAISRSGNRLRVDAQTHKPWQVRIVGSESRVADPLGHHMTRQARGALLAVNNGAPVLELLIAD